MMNRRAVLGVVGGLMATSCVSSLTEDSISNVKKETFVLVHGAWHGGWCWEECAQFLRSAGYKVFTPTLTGLGERVHLNSRNVNLSTHAQDIINVIEYEELDNVILVGHSYGGYIVTLVADAIKERLKRVVYLDAALPTEGNPFFPKSQHEAFLEQYRETYSMPPGSLKFLGIPEDHPKAVWVKRRLTPHPLGTFFEPVTFKNGGAKGLPKIFIRCTGNPRHKSGDPVIDLTKDDPEWTYFLIDTGHDAMVTEPKLLSDILSAENISG